MFDKERPSQIVNKETAFSCADSSVVEHTIADCEVDGSIPPRRFFANKQFILQAHFLTNTSKSLMETLIMWIRFHKLL